MLLGCIGDDFTGSSDLANTLAAQGMHVIQYNGVPQAPADGHVEAGVVALKTRTIAASEAVEQSLAALDWLKAQGCRQYLFKYCSTFDSTARGNIGPVLDALCERLEAPRAIVCPAFPATGRTVYQGHLFVGDRLLSESGMQNHPLTPMTDPDLRRWLALQSRARVGHVGYAKVAAGAAAIKKALAEAEARGERHIVVDALDEGDLHEIGQAASQDILVSGGSGIALGLPDNFRRAGLGGHHRLSWQGIAGPAAALCGSCSLQSRQQISEHAGQFPARAVSAGTILSGADDPQEVAEWIMANQGRGGPPLVYSSAEPEHVAAAQERFGKQRAAEAIEGFLATIARALVARGTTRLVVAGGETSGAVVSALAIPHFEVGPQIDPGVPALRAGGTGMALALKSGNFGAPDFFAKAARFLAGEACHE